MQQWRIYINKVIDPGTHEGGDVSRVVDEQADSPDRALAQVTLAVGEEVGQIVETVNSGLF